MIGALVGACITFASVACSPQARDTTGDAAVDLPEATSGAAGTAVSEGSAGAGGDSAATTAPTTDGSFAALQVSPPTASQLSAISPSEAAVRVLLTDAPVNAEAVNIEICGVELQERAAIDEDAGVNEERWLKVSSACLSFDLLKLQGGLTSELGLDALPPGDYGQIRLGLTHASIQVAGQIYPLTIPSGMQSGIKIGHDFHIEAGGLTTIALDFDAAKSIHDTGRGYVMSPVIAVVGELKEPMQEVRERATKHEARQRMEGAAGNDAAENVGETAAAGRAARDEAESPSHPAQSDAGTAAESTQPTTRGAPDSVVKGMGKGMDMGAAGASAEVAHGRGRD